MFTHLPIVGLGFAILLNIYAVITSNEGIRKLSLWSYLVLGICALLAYLTGDGAEEIMQTYPGITEEIIEPHETFSLLFFIGMMILAAIGMAGIYLAMKKEELLRKFNLILLIGAIIVSFFAIRTGATGGDIRHAEIQQGAYPKK